MFFHLLNELFSCWPVLHHAATSACTIAHNNPAYAAWLKANHLTCHQV